MAMSLETRLKAENISRPKKSAHPYGQPLTPRHLRATEGTADAPVFGCLSSAPLRRMLLQIAIASNASEACFIKTIRLPWPAGWRPLGISRAKVERPQTP